MAQPAAFFTTQLPTPRADAITCVGVRLDGCPEGCEGWIAAAAPLATTGETARAKRFVRPVDAARHLVGRALARRVLSGVLGRPVTAEFPAGPWGKPLPPRDVALAAPGLDFSIAHSGGLVVAAFCRAAAVGIDVEALRPLPDLPGLAAQLHPREAEAILALPEPARAEAFYRCWTRKEAVLKALGQGLNLPLDAFAVRPGPPDSDWLETPPAPQEKPSAPGWTTRDIAAGPDCRCCVAAAAPGLAIEVLLF